MKLSTVVIQSFSGVGDVVAWIKKVELVTKLQKVPDITSFLPLFLQKNELALYLEMSDKDMTENRLKKAFTEELFEVYEKLKRVK